MVECFRNIFTCRRRDNERGASAVEYGLLVAGIAAVIVVLVMTIGGTIRNKFDDTCTAIQGTADAPSATTSCLPADAK